MATSGAAKTCFFVVILAAGVGGMLILRAKPATMPVAPVAAPEAGDAQSPVAKEDDHGGETPTAPSESHTQKSDSPQADPSTTDPIPPSGKTDAATDPSDGEPVQPGDDAIMSFADPTDEFELPSPPGAQQPDPNPTPVDDLTPVVLDTGVKYWDIKVGEGDLPHENAMVICAFRAWRMDGRMIDSSTHQGYNLPFFKSRLVPGLQDAVWSMRTGGIRQVFIPADQGWGEEGKPPRIPPNADLLFEVQVMEIRNPAPPTSFEGIEPTTMDSGLQYWDLRVGEGDVVAPHSRVEVRYTGWLEDGDVLETTEFVRKPSKFDLSRSRVIAGWREGIPGMRVGGKRRLSVPPELGYGEARVGKVPLDATLVFEIDLIGTAPPDAWALPSSIEGIEEHVMDSGLVYWDIKSGDGAQPVDSSSEVVVHYTFWLSDGSIQQTTRDAEQPRSFALRRLVAGMSEGISTMNVGGVRQMRVPPDLGYGESGQPPEIPPNETLTIEVELMEIL